tara:strand:+ start:127 stop:318 length:192 start_codon:yes stop_codon:yes gene_type:complete
MALLKRINVVFAMIILSTIACRGGVKMSNRTAIMWRKLIPLNVVTAVMMGVARAVEVRTPMKS